MSPNFLSGLKHDRYRSTTTGRRHRNAAQPRALQVLLEDPLHADSVPFAKSTWCRPLSWSLSSRLHAWRGLGMQH